MPLALRALMVDLDGTLARTAEANVSAYTAALADFGVVLSPAELEPQIGGRHWKQFLPALLEQVGSSANPMQIAARKADIYAAELKHIALNRGLVSLLAVSRAHLKTALVTSASRVSVNALLEAHDLTHLFQVVVTGDDVQQHKPDPEAWFNAARQLGVTPQETLVYEDSDIGVQSAQAFGAQVIRILF